jgi:hypothetical protein
MTTETLFMNIVLTVAVLFVLGYIIYWRVIDVYRHRKHSIWYTHYNRALRNSLRIGSELREATDYFNSQVAFMQKQLLEGGCSAETYCEEMQALALSYCSAVTIYNNAKEALGIDADIAAADAYAKEFKLKWGYLSDD